MLAGNDTTFFGQYQPRDRRGLCRDGALGPPFRGGERIQERIRSSEEQLQLALQTLGLRLLILNASDPSEFEAAFATLVRERAGGLLVSTDALFSNRLDQLVALAVRHAVPTIHGRRRTGP
jgi:hypothetical protein